jgi:hypothetical protein
MSKQAAAGHGFKWLVSSMDSVVYSLVHRRRYMLLAASMVRLASLLFSTFYHLLMTRLVQVCSKICAVTLPVTRQSNQ